jgi:hypothetical protein
MRKIKREIEYNAYAARAWMAARGVHVSPSWFAHVESTRIFIARRTATGRRIFNEGELAALLRVATARRANRRRQLRPFRGRREDRL